MTEIVERLTRIEPDWSDIERRSRHLQRQRVLRRTALSLGALAAAAVLAGGAYAAATDWLTGRPAPPSVRADFGTYTPQLGFRPDPGKAVLVASDGDSHLYATTDAEGSYCIAVSAPWRNLGREPDGGTCISKATAEQPIVAGLPSGTADTLVLTGRVSVAGAKSVALRLPDGTPRTIPLGTSGFFISNIEGAPCGHGDWSPRLVALDAGGKPLAASTIPLVHEYRDTRDVPVACGMPVAPIGPPQVTSDPDGR